MRRDTVRQAAVVAAAAAGLGLGASGLRVEQIDGPFATPAQGHSSPAPSPDHREGPGAAGLMR